MTNRNLYCIIKTERGKENPKPERKNKMLYHNFTFEKRAENLYLVKWENSCCVKFREYFTTEAAARAYCERWGLK